jgi:hypothetical protein
VLTRARGALALRGYGVRTQKVYLGHLRRFFEWCGIQDSLFGFRVYPVRALLEVMQAARWMRRFDFDPEAAVRLAWRGVPPLNLPAPVRYLRPEEGGVSHFNYWRDNVLLSWMHFRLLLGFLARAPRLAARRFRSSRR